MTIQEPNCSATLVAVKKGAAVAVFVLVAMCFASTQVRVPIANSQAAPSTADKSAQSVDATAGIPTFYAHARQVIVAVEVWDKTTTGDDSWIPEGALAADPDGGAGVRNVLRRVPPPARGLKVQDFHVLDNGVEQEINYFKETDFPVVTTSTDPWSFDATTHGLWGTLLGCCGIVRSPYTAYLIGYIPPTLQPGECHNIQIVVPNHSIWTNRTQYCAAGKADAANTPEETELAARMQRIANSSKPGAMNVCRPALRLLVLRCAFSHQPVSNGGIGVGKRAGTSRGRLHLYCRSTRLQSPCSRADRNTVRISIPVVGLPLSRG